MTETPNTASDSVFIVHHDGQLHVMKSVGCFPADGSGSADENAAADHLRTMLGTTSVAQVNAANMPKAPLLLF